MPFQIIRNDITKMAVDAIVNTANPLPGYGPGLDSAVYAAAGIDELLAARRQIGEIACGECAITSGFNLPARYIIHTVGSPWTGGSVDVADTLCHDAETFAKHTNQGSRTANEVEILHACYQNALKLAYENKLESIAFPLIASGCYGFPKDLALKIALSEIERFPGINDMEVYLVVFDREAFGLSGELFGGIDSYISQNYVDAREEVEYYDSESAGRTGNIPRERLIRFGSGTNERRVDSATNVPRVDSATNVRESRLVKRFGRPVPNFRGKSAKSAESAPAVEKEVAFLSECAPEGEDRADFAESAPAVEEKVAFLSECAPARSLDDCLRNLDKSFMEMVFMFADAKGIGDVLLQKKANLDKRAFSKLRCGYTRNPSKTTALALAVALELNLDETKDLLARAGYALSPCSKLDLIVRYFIEHEVYDVSVINVALFDHDEQLLGSKA